MNIDVRLKQFSGPLELLLNLIGSNKLEISELALSEVTEQYIEYVEKMEETDVVSLSDFLVVAARLLLLKSSSLLPQFLPDEDEGPTLEEQLKRYKGFLEASKEINKRWESKHRAHFHVEPPHVPDEFVAPKNLSLELMHQSMVQLLSRLEPPKQIASTEIDRSVTLKQTIKRIQSMLKKKKKVNFQDTIKSSSNKTEVIIGFLALLELVKKQEVHLQQNNQFKDIIITRS